MANPRKFADKLEIIRRNEEKANAAYVQIMLECAELSDARKSSPAHTPNNIHISSSQNQKTWIGRTANEYTNGGMRQMWKGGSLPSVLSSPNNNSVNNVNVNTPQNSYSALNDGFQQQQSYGVVPQHRHRRITDSPSGPIFQGRTKYHQRYPYVEPYKSNLLQQPFPLEDQNESLGGWRRAASDSAIQQTLGEPPKPNVNGSGINLQPCPASRVMQSQSQNQQIGHMDLHSLARSPPASIRHQEVSRNNAKIQADTSSLPDLSNLSIPSPIQNPIDREQEGKGNTKSREQQNHFQAPYSIPPRRAAQVYTRLPSASDIRETLHREQKPDLNLFTDIGVCSSPATVSNSAMMHSVSAPLTPITPPPIFGWPSTPASPLTTSDILSQPTSDPLQQLFQIHNDSIRDNGNSNPPPYNFDDDTYFCSNNYPSNKQNIYRMNSGPPNLNSKIMCDHQLESTLMRDPSLLRMKSAHQEIELSPADLNSVRVALNPLDFEDVQMLQDNAQLVDQSAEEQFRLERNSYQ